MIMVPCRVVSLIVVAAQLVQVMNAGQGDHTRQNGIPSERNLPDSDSASREKATNHKARQSKVVHVMLRSGFRANNRGDEGRQVEPHPTFVTSNREVSYESDAQGSVIMVTSKTDEDLPVATISNDSSIAPVVIMPVDSKSAQVDFFASSQSTDVVYEFSPSEVGIVTSQSATFSLSTHVAENNKNRTTMFASSSERNISPTQAVQHSSIDLEHGPIVPTAYFDMANLSLIPSSEYSSFRTSSGIEPVDVWTPSLNKTQTIAPNSPHNTSTHISIDLPDLGPNVSSPLPMSVAADSLSLGIANAFVHNGTTSNISKTVPQNVSSLYQTTIVNSGSAFTSVVSTLNVPILPSAASAIPDPVASYSLSHKISPTVTERYTMENVPETPATTADRTADSAIYIIQGRRVSTLVVPVTTPSHVLYHTTGNVQSNSMGKNRFDTTEQSSTTDGAIHKQSPTAQIHIDASTFFIETYPVDSTSTSLTSVYMTTTTSSPPPTTTSSPPPTTISSPPPKTTSSPPPTTTTRLFMTTRKSNRPSIRPVTIVPVTTTSTVVPRTRKPTALWTSSSSSPPITTGLATLLSTRKQTPPTEPSSTSSQAVQVDYPKKPSTTSKVKGQFDTKSKNFPEKTTTPATGGPPSLPHVYIIISLHMTWSTFCPLYEEFRHSFSKLVEMAIRQNIDSRQMVIANLYDCAGNTKLSRRSTLLHKSRVLRFMRYTDMHPLIDPNNDRILEDRTFIKLNRLDERRKRTSEVIDVYLYVVDYDQKPDVDLTKQCYHQLEDSPEKLKGSPFFEKIVSKQLIDNSPSSPSPGVMAAATRSTPIEPGVIVAIVVAPVVVLVILAVVIIKIIISRRRGKAMRSYFTEGRVPSFDSRSTNDFPMASYPRIRRSGRGRKSNRSTGFVNNALQTEEGVTSNPVNQASLASMCYDADLLGEEFKLIPNLTSRLTDLPEGCEEKNRFANVIPNAKTRVVLRLLNDAPTSQYINANYVRGYMGERAYIVAQAPMENTIYDFWRSVWENHSQVIVMLTDLQECDLPKCTPYWPSSEGADTVQRYQNLEISLKKREVKREYIMSKLRLKDSETRQWRDLVHFWFLGWPHHGVPESPMDILHFMEDVRPYMAISNGPTIVHCSPGTGRAGTFLAIHTCMEQYDQCGTVDVLSSVHRLRHDRAGLLQTKEQYAFVYTALNEYASSGSGPAEDSSESASEDDGT